MPTAQVAEELGRKPSSVSPARDSLIKKGLIYSSERGLIAFTVPHFGRFLRAQPAILCRRIRLSKVGSLDFPRKRQKPESQAPPRRPGLPRPGPRPAAPVTYRARPWHYPPREH